MSQSQSKSHPSIQRDARGRVLPGSKLYKLRERVVDFGRLSQIVDEEVSDDDWREIVGKAKEQAKTGSVSAREFLLKVKQQSAIHPGSSGKGGGIDWDWKRGDSDNDDGEIDDTNDGVSGDSV